tara:strand:- start:45 stop:689 length:645 start_codon:yes stop_codon:yes gene_type:complete
VTKVYFFNINEDFRKSYKFYLSQIPIELRKDILKFRNISDQHRCLVGKLLVRFALFQEGYGHNVLLNCKRDINNRPYLNEKIDFNISHSGEYVVCAVTNNGFLGVDIERMDSIKIESLLYLFNESEIEKINNRLDMFYLLWTQKEALSKAIGKGLVVNLKDILIEDGIGFYGNSFWNLKSFDIKENYMCHMAYKDNFEPEFKEIFNSDLILKNL